MLVKKCGISVIVSISVAVVQGTFQENNVITVYTLGNSQMQKLLIFFSKWWEGG